MKAKKVISSLLLTVCCGLFGNCLTIEAAQEWPQGPDIAGGSAIVMEVNSGTVLYEKNAHEQLYPASITKIMTALLAVENSDLQEEVVFSYDSVHKTEGSSIWRDVDEVMTMEQCLYAMMLNSANECAYAVAEHTGGTYEAFIEMMNQRAAELGCTDTHFSNPHGLTEEDHYTSSYDMALIAREAIQNDTFKTITGTKRYTIPPTNKHPDESTYLNNHQKMMYEGETNYYPYCIGGKTGYTEAAGNTLVTFAEKDGMTLVCVVMQEKAPGHYEDSIALLDYCFSNFKTCNIAENLGETPEVLPEDSFLTAEAFADIDKNAAIALPITAEFGEATLEVIPNDTSTEVAATLQYTYGDHVVGSADIARVQQQVKEYSFGDGTASQEQEDTKVVHVNVTAIVLGILGIAVLVAAGYGGYRFKDKFYLLRYRFHARRNPYSKGKIIQKKKNRRRKRRL